MKPDQLGSDSPAQPIVSSLRRAILLDQVVYTDYERPARKMVGSTVKHETLAASHVYDFDHPLDSNHPDFFSDGKTPWVDDMIPVMPGLPHAHTIFVERMWGSRYPADGDAWMLAATYASEDPQGIAWHQFVWGGGDKRQRWVWFGGGRLNRVDLDEPIIGDDGLPCHHTVEPEAWCFGKGEEAENNAKIALHSGVALAGLLNLKALQADALIVTPAESYALPGMNGRKPRAFEVNNPSVSIVRIGTRRILRTQPSEPTGATVRGHDRRSHWRRIGDRLVRVRECKINGGAIAPVTKVVRNAHDR